MIKHPCANEPKHSNASHLAPQLSRLQALHPSTALGQPAREEKSLFVPKKSPKKYRIQKYKNACR